jgi:hypothetical protein
MSSLLYRDVFWKYVDANTKRELGLDFRDDGEFYMNFNRDFLKVSPCFSFCLFRIYIEFNRLNSPGSKAK